MTAHGADRREPDESRWTAVAAAVLIVATVLICYWPAIQGGFIWNDVDYVTKPSLQSWHGLWRIWFDVGATEQYYPLLHSAFWVEHWVFKDVPAGYHLANVVLHSVAAILLWRVLRRLQLPGAWLAAMVFAVHPVCVESVAWISEQKNTFSTVLFLAAALAYLDYDKTRRLGAYWTAFGFFVAALLGKSVTASLPAALLVVFWWQRGRLSWRSDIRPLMAWLCLGAADGWFTGWVEHHIIGAAGPDFALSLGQRVLIAGRALWFYAGKLVWPADLIFIYPRWEVRTDQLWQFLYPLVLALAVIGAWAIRGRTRAPLALALLYIGILFPTLGFFNVYAFIFSFVADHWQYLASIVVIAGVAAAWGHWRARANSGAPAAVAPVVVVGLGVLCWRQCHLYAGMENFYRLTLAKNPSCWMAHNNLGLLLAESKRFPEAIEQYKETIAIKPDYGTAYNNLGSALEQLPDRKAEAFAWFQKAVQVSPNLAIGYSNLGKMLAQVPGRTADTIACYSRAIQLDPANATICNNFANLLGEIPGRLPDALIYFQKALEIDPRFSGAHFNFANHLAQIPGRLPEALAHYEAALRIDPDYFDAHLNCANQLAGLPGREADARAHYEAAVRIRPESADAHNNLGVWFATHGEPASAAREFETVLRFDPTNGAARRNLTLLRGSSGQR